MNFFVQIHRSIVDPTFYLQVITLPVKKIAVFLIKLIAVTVLILSVTHSWRIVEPNRGLPAILPTLFPNMQITSTGMIPNDETPYAVNPVYIADFISVFSNAPLSLFEIPDSAVVVDGRSDIAIEKSSSILFFLAADILHVKFGPDIYLKIPYSFFVSKNEVMTFTREGISKYLKRRLLPLFINLYIQHCFMLVINIMFSIFFLSLAAYIFKTRQIKSFSIYLKLASFAITPIAIENVFIALSGAKVVWMRNVSIFISLFIIYRAIKYISTKDTNTSPGE